MNTSGFVPLDQRVLVLPDPVQEKIGSIIVPVETREKEKFAMMRATLIASGANAWAEAKAHPDFIAPAPGDRIVMAKYGGVEIRGDDGVDYRLLNDEDIIGTVLEG